MGHARNNNLDFLRGLSVVLVILYHSKISINDLDLFKGGYLGVDIFFLLSGYFITKIIFEIQKDNFLKNILTFLLSRLRKLLPSIITLSLLIMFIGSFLIKPNKIDENVGFLLQGLFFLSNIFASISKTNYFYEERENLSLHLWSLGVEFQFYIFFFILLFIAYKKNQKNINKILFFIFVSSLLTYLYLDSTNPTFNFYFFFSRAWEFVAGSFIFNYTNQNKSIYFKNKYAFIFITSLIILSVIINSFINSTILLLIIIFLSSILFFEKENIFNKNNLICTAGRSSYSLYIFHYPILTIVNNFYFENSYKIIAIIIIIMISILNYRFVEIPFKNKNFLNHLKFLIFIFISYLIFFSFKVFISKYPEYFINKNSTDIKNIFLKKIDDNCINAKYNFYCRKGAGDKNIYLIGDSHLQSLFFPLSDKFYDFSIFNLTASACYFLPNFNSYNLYNKVAEKTCNTEIQNDRLKFIKDKKNSIIIIGGRLPLYQSGLEVDLMYNAGLKYLYSENFNSNKLYKKWNIFYSKNNKKYTNNIQEYKLSIQEIEKIAKINNSKLIIIYPIPNIYVDPYYFYKRFKNRNYKYEKKLYDQRVSVSKKILDSLTYKNIVRVYPESLFCDETYCYSKKDNSIIYSDYNHLNIIGNQYLVNKIHEEINNK